MSFPYVIAYVDPASKGFMLARRKTFARAKAAAEELAHMSSKPLGIWSDRSCQWLHASFLPGRKC